MYAPDAFVRRSRPSTIREFVKKIFGYGIGRLNQTFVSPSWVCALRLSVALFPVYWILAPLISMKLALLSLAAYAAGDILMAAKIFLDTRSIRVTALSAFLFPAMHMAYGTGLWWGLIAKALHLKRIRGGTIDIIRVKRFADSYSSKASSGHTKEPGDSIGVLGKMDLEHKAVPAASSSGM